MSAPIAYGALELKPWEFGRLTFDEFYQMVEGYRWRSEQTHIRMAHLVVPVINACHTVKLKGPLTVEKFLGYDPATKSRQEENRKKTGKKLKAELASFIKEMGGGR